MTKKKIKYSVIIPTFNEEYFIDKNIKALKNIRDDIEVIVSDGGSNDSTIEICKKENVLLINSQKGRGRQLNAGVKFAKGEILIFLHADTFLPENAFKLMDNFFINEGNKICRFLLGFDVEHRALNLYTSFSKYDTLFTRFGDSAVIVRKSFFDILGGFPDTGIFEDVQFFQKAKRLANISILPGKAISSARRFVRNGIIKQQLINGVLFLGCLLKVSPDTLTSIYNITFKKKNSNSLIIFLRYPKIGTVKTRLACTTTNKFALHFYKRCVTEIIHEIKKVSQLKKYIFYSGKNEKLDVRKWLGKNFFYVPQEGNDLGGRMKDAFQNVFSHGTEKAIIVGTDVPDLNKGIVEQAIEALDNADVVIGPSKDGGYYLLGMKKFHGSLFEEMKYSTSSVFPETISKIEKLGLEYFVLPELHDIDNEEELLDWLSNGSATSLKKEIDLVYNLLNGKAKQRCVHCAQ